MNRVFFTQELECVATYWRIFRKDGVILGFISHDRDIVFDGIRHRAAPGMLPSSIRKTDDLNADSAEVEGALSHDAISAKDIANGRLDNARIEIGAVDWENGDAAALYSGMIGKVEQGDQSFTAELLSSKAQLGIDLVPRTSPSCRASFCGPGCGLSSARFTHRSCITNVDLDLNAVELADVASSALIEGGLRMLSGPQTGLQFGILGENAGMILLDRALDPSVMPGIAVVVREGCDHTIATCDGRFSNAVNFRGEPFLPGNDMLARYPTAR